MKAKSVLFVAVATIVFSLCATASFAQPPPLPHSFYGTLTVDGEPAPLYTKVEAKGDGVTTGIAGNPLVTTEVGKYGSSDYLGAKLIVQGHISEGSLLTFYIDGKSADQTSEWHSGEFTELNLTLASETPAPEEEEEEGGGGGGGGGGGTQGPTLKVSLFGKLTSVSTSSTGKILSMVTGTSADGRVTITISAGTTALDKVGNALTSLTVKVDSSPPAPPEGAHIIGLAYIFEPSGATFDPPLSITWKYEDADIPEGVAEEDLVLAYYDPVAKEWKTITSSVNAEDNTITAIFNHFTCFAIIGKALAAPEAEPEEEAEPEPEAKQVAPKPVVKEEPEPAPEPEPEAEPEPEIVEAEPEEAPELEVEEEVAAPEEEEAVAEAMAPEGPPPSPVSQIKWPIIGGVVGGILGIGLLVFFLSSRKKRVFY